MEVVSTLRAGCKSKCEVGFACPKGGTGSGKKKESNCPGYDNLNVGDQQKT